MIYTINSSARCHEKSGTSIIQYSFVVKKRVAPQDFAASVLGQMHLRNAPISLCQCWKWMVDSNTKFADHISTHAESLIQIFCFSGCLVRMQSRLADESESPAYSKVAIHKILHVHMSTACTCNICTKSV
jgi:hypothetical protein